MVESKRVRDVTDFVIVMLEFVALASVKSILSYSLSTKEIHSSILMIFTLEGVS